MVALDWIFLVLMLLSLAIGAWRGLVYEVLSLATWFAAFLLAQWFAPAAANYLPMAGSSETIRYAAGFVVVFIGAVFAGSILTWLVSRLFQVAGLRPADRVLGAVFGAMRGVVVALASVGKQLLAWPAGNSPAGKNYVWNCWCCQQHPGQSIAL
jgi:membrane protein required for colicin V production